jgi:hypothetical protein
MQHMLRSAEGLLGVNDPLVLVERAKEACKGTRLLQRFERAVEAQLLLLEQMLQTVGELTAEHLAQHLYRQKEAGALGADPACPSGGKPSGRHDAVDVRVVGERLSPSVQHAQKADLGS